MVEHIRRVSKILSEQLSETKWEDKVPDEMLIMILDRAERQVSWMQSYIVDLEDEIDALRLRLKKFEVKTNDSSPSPTLKYTG
jgi:polyhydroxyalkanoate synthesis regulator phasin